MAVLYTNNAVSMLAFAITPGATSLTVTAGQGAKFPTPSGGDFFYATLASSSSTEIVKVTARATDTLTIFRAQEGTTAAAFATGDAVSLFVTAGMLSQLKVDALAAANNPLTGIKTATFNSQTTIDTTIGAISVDWSSAQNQKQTEPTGTITYYFGAPPGPCHLQLIIDSDGYSTAQTINWPASVIWMGATWAGAANKSAVINFWYDGTKYYAVGTNQV